MAKRTLDEKFRRDKLRFVQIKNKDLVCKNCKKRFDDTSIPGNTSKCEAFVSKPNTILDGGDCNEHEAEE